MKQYPRVTDFATIDHLVYHLCDGQSQAIGVEIFDHPDAVKLSNGEQHGTWVIGGKTEVLRWLEAQGYEDYAIQITHGPPTEEDE